MNKYCYTLHILVQWKVITSFGPTVEQVGVTTASKQLQKAK